MLTAIPTNDSKLAIGLTGYALWNMAALLLVLLDKRRARKGERRIRERTFFLWALSFGAAGILLGMRLCRHKTRHLSFRIGIPLLCLVNLACGYLLWRPGGLIGGS